MTYPSGQPPQHGQHPPLQGYPPQHGHRAQPGHGDVQPNYPPNFGAPRKSRAGLFIGLGFGLVVVLGLLFHFIFVDNEWMDREPAYDEPGTITSSTGQQYANLDARQLIGRWCAPDGAYSQFEANGRFVDQLPRQAQTIGTWRDNAGGSVVVLVGSQSVVSTFRVSGNQVTLTTQGRATTLTRC